MSRTATRTVPSVLVPLLITLTIVAATSARAACPCEGDLTGNGVIDASDLALVLAAWGPCPGCPPAGGCAADFNGDCQVDSSDLAILLAAWGVCTALPPNDACSSPTEVVGFSGSSNPWCTIGATTDGPTIPSGCTVPPITQIHNDIWFTVTAPVTATLQISVCADFDARIAVYGENIFGSCACPGGLFGGLLRACAGTSSFPACASGAVVLVPVEAGDCLRIRVGGATPADTGNGHLDINIYVPPCEIVSAQTLPAAGLETNTEFGIAADISGDVAVVGAIFDDLLFGLTNAGTARVYRFNGVAWVAETNLISPDVFASQRFGVSAAVSGDRIVVGAAEVDAACVSDPNCDTGIAYVYEYDGAAWVFRQNLLPLNGEGSPKDHFGARVDIDGTRIIVGASDDDNANGVRAGAAYVYELITIFGGQVWIETAKLTASDGANFDGFGSDVAVSGPWAIVGADGAGVGGKAYLFQDTGSSWVQVAVLEPGDLEASDSFGYAVAIDGNAALVGAPHFCCSGADPGAVYVYENIAGFGWAQTATLTAHDGIDGDNFGSAVALDVNAPTMPAALVGASGNNGDRGAAYLYWRPAGGWVERARLTAASGLPGDAFGIVAVGDGRGLVGAYLDDPGRVFIFKGLFECTGNGVAEACDIANGLPDSDGDGVPDVCEP